VAERAAAFDEQLAALRHREVDRLLHMLDARPDEGLRFAIPMTFQPGRGVGRRGWRLVERLVEFSLGALGGSGGVDYWDIDHAHHRRLVEKYRQLANREIGLGRHRRAAYIFAELLGDLRAAAATLADGGHFREAAALYEQRLKDPHAAARCLERGGLLSEAITFYHRLDHHEKVGELHEKLEQWDFAEQAFRRAVIARLEHGDRVGAAHLLEVKLRRLDEAFDVLRHGWPDSAQAALCLDESFKLLARQAAHERASGQVTSLAKESARSIPLATCFAQLANTYPDATVRLLAADQTRVLASHYVTAASPGDRHKLLQAVQALAPQDRLLARDCARFENPPLARPGGKGRRSTTFRLVYEFKLPTGNWKTVLADGSEFYAAGFRENEVLLVRGRWDGTIHQPAGKPWRVRQDPQGCAILTGTNRAFKDSRIFLHVLNADPVPEDRVFPKTDWFGERTVGGHRGFSIETVGLLVDFNGIVHIINTAKPGAAVISHSAANGDLLRTTAIPIPESTQMPLPLVFADTDQELLLGRRNQLKSTSSGRSSDRTPTPIRSVDTFYIGKRLLVVARLECGGFTWFGNPLFAAGSHFAQELSEPFGCCYVKNRLVIADANQIQAYQLDGSTPQLVCFRQDLQLADPIALHAVPENCVAVFLSGGQVNIYEID
jgi:hypothetical protein